MTIDHPRHDELAGRIDYVDIATARGYGRRPTNRRNPIICDADNTILYDLTVDRIEDGTTDNVQERHPHLLTCLPCAALLLPHGLQIRHVDGCPRGEGELLVDGHAVQGFVAAALGVPQLQDAQCTCPPPV
jgi:hypothetical protein